MKIAFYIGHVLIHVISLVSVLDVYFTSTVVQNVLPLNWTAEPDAKRLVLFVADGLRADKFFELDGTNLTKTPFLRSVILHKGAWGVSHTRAPTESRPAHIAMLGGFYEDPSALLAAWKYNPTEFDSVLNESRETWAFGGDDVITFFNKGTAEDHVHIFPHHYHANDFADLDKGVFADVKRLLRDSKTNEQLYNRLQNDKIIFFLHLAGIDSNGHVSHPGSRRYIDNIRIVDKGIDDIVKTFDRFYNNDNRTAYVFTGDHGMTDEGGHGGSDPSETRTPFVAWGPGVIHSHRDAVELSEDDISEVTNWGLNPNNRFDIQQIDVSVLMASLIGVPYPVNSVGKLPQNYLAGLQSKAEKMYGRAKQIVETFMTKRNNVRKNELHFLFWKFKRSEDQTIFNLIHSIKENIKEKEFDIAIEKSEELTDFAIQGLHHYQKHRPSTIQLSILLSLVGWIYLSLVRYAISSELIVLHDQGNTPRISRNILCFGFLLICGLAIRVHQFLSPWMYYLYTAMPLCVWLVIFCYQVKPCQALFQNFWQKSKVYAGTAIMTSAWFLLLSIGFYHREMFSVLAIGLSAMQDFTPFRRPAIRIMWIMLCVCLAVFPLLPEVIKGNTDRRFILFAGLCGCLVCIYLTRYHNEYGDNLQSRRSYSWYQLLIACLPGITSCIGYAEVYSSPIAGKIVLVLGWIIPLFFSSNSFQRLTVMNSLHISAYLLISQSHDALFFVVLSSALHVWVIMEAVESKPPNTRATQMLPNNRAEAHSQARAFTGDIRRTCSLIFFLAIGFFGIFSVQSMNHFHARSLPFLPVTNSFQLLVLFFYKLLLHYIAIAVSFCTLMSLKNLRIASLWFLVAAICDILYIHFYLSVKTGGSWAEIGFSIANACIIAGLPIGLSIILLIGKVIVSIEARKCAR